MLKKLFKSLKKNHLRHPAIFLAFALFALALTSPWPYQELGNIFFGRVGKLYNVNLAQFFFSYASHPLFWRPAPYGHYQLSRTFFIDGDLASALAEAKKELEFYPDHVRTYYVLGLTYGYLNDEKKAIASFSKYIETDPTSWAARNDKAWLQFRIGDIDGALVTMEPVAHDTGNPWVQNTYGTLLMNKKRYKEAEQAFLHAQSAAGSMTEESWGIAYPGNDPRIYGTGLNAMKSSIESNLALVHQKLGN